MVVIMVVMVIKTSVVMIILVAEVLVLLWVPQLVSLSSLSPWFSPLYFTEEGNVSPFQTYRSKRSVFCCFLTTRERITDD